MRTMLTIVIIIFVASASPAAAQRLGHKTPFDAKPRAIAAITLASQRVELMAVTRRARADTPLRRAHLYESEAMSKVMPGYPQPAFISVDLRLEF